MAYLPLNNSNFEIGDIVLCIENRFANTFDHQTGFRTFGSENIPFLSLKKGYEILTKDIKRRKVGITADDGIIRQIPYYRLGIKETEY